jgi:hypothetical protein
MGKGHWMSCDLVMPKRMANSFAGTNRIGAFAVAITTTKAGKVSVRVVKAKGKK